MALLGSHNVLCFSHDGARCLPFESWHGVPCITYQQVIDASEKGGNREDCVWGEGSE